MPNEMPKEIIDSNNQSSSENLKKVFGVDKQTEDALNKLGTDTEKKFYEEDSEKKVVTYKIEVVKQYLTALYEKVKDIETTREARQKLVEEGNTSAWIMAVQIALESLGKEEYDVGQIDGILGKDTKKAVKNFQTDNGLDPDGAPGRDTIKVLLDKMGGAVEQEEDEFKDVKVKEEQEVPAEEVKAEDLVEGLPEGATVEFKEGSSVDKTKEGEEQEVTVIVKVGEKVKEIVIIVKIENGKMEAEEKKQEEKNEEKEEDEKMPEESWLNQLTIEDLGSWNNDGKFEFKDGVVDEETGKLTVRDKEIEKIGEGGNGFGYLVEDGRLLIGDFKNGVLNGNGVEFYPWIKSLGEYEDGKLKNGEEIVRESDIDEVNVKEDGVDITEEGVDVKIEVKDGKPMKCYVIENASVSLDLENKEDGLYLKNRESGLKLKNKYSATRIAKILYDYKDKEGSFSTDLSEGSRSKKLVWTPANGGEKKVVYRYADNLISDELLKSEGLMLSGWLNEYRETHREFKLEEYGEFDEEGKFVFKEGVEKTDEDGKKYIEYSGEKYYEYKEGMNGLGYQVNSSADWWSFYIGNFVDGKCDGEGIIIHSDGVRYEGEWKNDMSEGKGVTTWSNGNKFEGEYKEDEREKGKFTLVTPGEIAGEYEVQRDDIGLKIISEGEHKGKYINDEGWEILDVVISEEEYEDLCKKTDLTLDDVKKIVNYARITGQSLILDGGTSIDKDIAAELGKHQGYLYLNGLTSIDKDIAAELGKHHGSLSLDGLTSIDKDIAAELGKLHGSLSLDGLTSIDKDIAAELGKHQGYLSLLGLTSITDDVVDELANVENLYINEDILTETQKKKLGRE